MSDFVLKLVVVIGLALLALLGIRNCQKTQELLEQRTGEVEQQDRTATATTGILEDINQGTAETQRVEVVVHEIRTEYQRQYQQAAANDPSIAAWGAARIPQRVRDLARERRLNREDRLGRPGAGRADDGQEPGPGG